jgi:hypothetical protein
MADAVDTRTPWFSRAKKFTLAGTLGAAALGVGAAVTLTGSAAYAVDLNDDGTVRVEVNDTKDAEGLEQALADHGIKAKVDFPPDGYKCNPDRFTSVGDGDAGVTSTGYADGSFVWQVDPTNYSLDGDVTLVIEISQGWFDEGVQTRSGAKHVAKGSVGECDPVENEYWNEPPMGHDWPEEK